MLNWLCANKFGLGWAYDAITFARQMLTHFHTYVFYIQYILYIWTVLELFWLFFLPPFLSLVYVSVSWHRNVSLLRPGTLFIPGHLRLLILLLLISGFVMRMPERNSRRTFLDEMFIQNAESFCQISSTLTYPMSFTVGFWSHCVTPRSHVLPCRSRSFTPTCMELILQYFSFILAFEVRACCHTGVGLWCASCPEGRASWLPRMWASEDRVQRRDDLCFLRASRGLGRSSVYTMFDLC